MLLGVCVDVGVTTESFFVVLEDYWPAFAVEHLVINRIGQFSSGGVPVTLDILLGLHLHLAGEGV